MLPLPRHLHIATRASTWASGGGGVSMKSTFYHPSAIYMRYESGEKGCQGWGGNVASSRTTIRTPRRETAINERV